jgi:hypothetical protein
MPTKRYGSALKQLIERYGEDTSLLRALQLESAPKPGRPSIPVEGAKGIYMLVELAVDAGYGVRPACRLFDDFFGLGFGEDRVRYRYFTGEKICRPLLKKHRKPILEWYAENYSDWAEHIRAKSPNITIG